MRSAITALLILTTTAAHAQHHTLARDASRSSTSAHADPGPAPADLAAPTWVFPASDPAVPNTLTWIGFASPVVEGDLVYALTRQNTTHPAQLFAVDRSTGLKSWSADLPNIPLDSWSSPTIDPVHRAILVPAANQVRCYDLRSGALRWTTTLEDPVVNATIAITTDLPHRQRALITTYEGFYTGGDGAHLVCINTSPRRDTNDPDAYPPPNPHDPGDIVWSIPLHAGASGATPAYHRAHAYVATAGDFDLQSPGSVLAFDIRHDNPDHALRWRTDLTGNDAFFGGLTVRNNHLYAATYDFYGDTTSARLLKLDATTGDIIWSTPSNRTETIPVPLADDTILLSTGLLGFGSVATLERFDQSTNPPALTASSAHDTWNDNGNNILEPGEFDIIGGWTLQPHVVTNHPSTLTPVAYVGSLAPPSGSFFSGASRLNMIDLSKPFTDPAFLLATAPNSGGAPAVAHNTLYTVGPDGLHAYNHPPTLDLDDNSRFDIEDVYDWSPTHPRADVNHDGTIDQRDQQTLINELRRNEQRDTGVRP